jgi:hypothetical protein
MRPVVRRGRIELPAVPIAFHDLVAAFELFAVFVVDAEGAADVVHAVLIRGRVVAARGLVADRVRLVPPGVNVAGREDRARLGVALELVS